MSPAFFKKDRNKPEPKIKCIGIDEEGSVDFLLKE